MSPDPEALVITVLSGLTVSEVCTDNILTARLHLHLTRVGVHVPVTPAHWTIPGRPHAGAGTGDSAIAAAAIVRQLHPLHAVLHHEVAEVDVGPAVRAAHHVRSLVTMVLTVGGSGVILTLRPVNLHQHVRNKRCHILLMQECTCYTNVF